MNAIRAMAGINHRLFHGDGCRSGTAVGGAGGAGSIGGTVVIASADADVDAFSPVGIRVLVFPPWISPRHSMIAFWRSRGVRGRLSRSFSNIRWSNETTQGGTSVSGSKAIGLYRCWLMIWPTDPENGGLPTIM